VQRLTEEAIVQIDALPETAQSEQQRVVQRWAESVMGLGIDVKGVWLVDFDCGSGYYCWQHPEESLQYFHGYEDGFRGRVKLQ
jgi:hypothetical protein